MNVTNPMFYTGTFVNNAAAGLLPAWRQDLGALENAMQSACSVAAFDPARCKLLSQAVGAARTTENCAFPLTSPPTAVFVAPTSAATAQGGVAVLAAVPGAVVAAPIPTATPATLGFALASLGSTPTTLALC